MLLIQYCVLSNDIQPEQTITTEHIVHTRTTRTDNEAILLRGGGKKVTCPEWHLLLGYHCSCG